MMPAISVKGLSAAYSDKKKLVPVLSNVSLELHPGDFFSLFGQNGSGKSTLLSLLAGITPARLKITGAEQLPSVNGKKIAELKRREVARLISYMPQTVSYAWDFKAFDVILSGRFPYSRNGFYSAEDKDTAQKVISELGIEELADKTLSMLSGGEFQKIRLARCLCQQTPFLLLDEPTSGLDYFYEPSFLDFLREQSKKRRLGVLISIHNLDAATKFSDRLLLLPRLEPAVSLSAAEAENHQLVANLLKIQSESQI